MVKYILQFSILVNLSHHRDTTTLSPFSKCSLDWITYPLVNVHWIGSLSDQIQSNKIELSFEFCL